MLCGVLVLSFCLLHDMLWCVVVWCVVLCCAVLCCAVLCSAVLCCGVVVWCGVVLCCVETLGFLIKSTLNILPQLLTAYSSLYLFIRDRLWAFYLCQKKRMYITYFISNYFCHITCILVLHCDISITQNNLFY